MKTKFKCDCGSETKRLFAANDDQSTWRKVRQRKFFTPYAKLKRPSIYKLVLKCKSGICGLQHVFKGPSKAEVLEHVRKQNKKARS